jgi:sec-independent protein translocase protein TatA
MTLESLFLLGNLGTSEIILIVVAILLFFGGKKIPELMRGIGNGVREFNSAKNNVKSQIEDGMREQPKEDEKK